MKRDLDLYRDLLLSIERFSDPAEAVMPVTRTDGITLYDAEESELPATIRDADPAVVLRHCILATQDGLLDAQIMNARADRSGDGRVNRLLVAGLTSDGHDFLDSVRGESIYQQAKDRVLSVAGSVSPSILKTVAEMLIRDKLGI